VALTGGEDGLEHIRELVAALPSGTRVALEHAEDQAEYSKSVHQCVARGGGGVVGHGCAFLMGTDPQKPRSKGEDDGGCSEM